MSWSFNGRGKPADLLRQAEASFRDQKCNEPEEGIKGNTLNILRDCLQAMDPAKDVVIEASGSQASAETEGHFNNTLHVKVQPVY